MEENLEANGGLPAASESPPPVKRQRLRKLGRWFLVRYRARLQRESRLTAFAAGGLALFGAAAMALAALGMPTGLGVWLDMLLFQSANGALMLMVGFVLSCLFSFLYIPLPRRLSASFIYTGVQGVVILHYTEVGFVYAIILGLLYALIGLIFSLLLGVIATSGIRPVRKVYISAALAATAGITAIGIGWPAPLEPPARQEAASDNNGVNESVAVVEPLEAVNPASAGDYSVLSFSYGSGKDKYRGRFGEEVDLITEPVDASDYITYWPKLKSAFWGFDQHELPLNGTVWMPEGDGPFPLVLIVHGNHLMEYFSDGGYAYLGELLASRGMIAVSVDANFLNYSVWSSLPNDDMKMRGWLLLKHLQQLQTLSESNGSANPFEGRIDWEKVALIGHSRGGQAVSIAADRGRWFAEDETFQSLEEINIRSVIAIAPTDKRVDDLSAKLTDVNYLTLQGAMDGDVNNFYGERQYHRTTFGAQSDLFKAAVYLSRANHSQFNTSWGHMDERLPGGLLLNRKGMMPAEDQRLAAKVFISAFLEATLHGRQEYKALFQDYRSGADWLPTDTTDYIVRYDDANMARLASFDSSRQSGIERTDAEGMKSAAKQQAKDRDGNHKGTSGMALHWEKPGALFTLSLSKDALSKSESEADRLVFSLSNLEWELSNGTYEEPLPPLPDLEIAIATRDGASYILPLRSFMMPGEPAYTSFLTLGKLEREVKNSKYKNPTEAVAQTYIIPLALFEHNKASAEDKAGNGAQTAITAGDISSVAFRFQSERGKVLLDDIGFMPGGGAYVHYRQGT
ncbi:alpha/beta hydrolase [Paenibacillus soyae]|uniref:Alpha/beta hydrolase n=1 Tax=Paenibacillus soyae TaxID=2969249 RepID=A0A9X2MJS8_9BACL|nr:alpha/beta hydrolase [Paenibacillus soyae]MCR2803158.1 alpha/beta hydrolase [Paenibacillus soyae]